MTSTGFVAFRIIVDFHVSVRSSPYVFQTNVPNSRLEYRRQTLLGELLMIKTKRPVDLRASIARGPTIA